jgi:hypothetical protein
MDKNRHFAKLMGIKPILPQTEEEYESGNLHYPDFTDVREVLKVISKKKWYNLFMAKLIYWGDNVEAIDWDGNIDVDYVINPGMLRDKVINFLEKP